MNRAQNCEEGQINENNLLWKVMLTKLNWHPLKVKS